MAICTCPDRFGTWLPRRRHARRPDFHPKSLSLPRSGLTHWVAIGGAVSGCLRDRALDCAVRTPHQSRDAHRRLRCCCAIILMTHCMNDPLRVWGVRTRLHFALSSPAFAIPGRQKRKTPESFRLRGSDNPGRPAPSAGLLPRALRHRILRARQRYGLRTGCEARAIAARVLVGVDEIHLHFPKFPLRQRRTKHCQGAHYTPDCARVKQLFARFRKNSAIEHLAFDELGDRFRHQVTRRTALRKLGANCAG